MNNQSCAPTVFVGIATWNRPKMVKDAINSVVSQSFTNFRCIVSDNASNPEHSQLVKQYVDGLDDPRVSFYQQPVNCGENGQCRWFLDQCKEKYFLFLHDDDLLEPELIEAALQILESNHQVDFFTSNQYLFDEPGHVLETVTREYNTGLMRDGLSDGIVDKPLERELLRGVFGLSGTVFRTESVRECGLEDASDTYPFDFNVMLRQVERGKQPWWDNRKLVGYRWHEGQESKQNNWEFNERHIRGYMKILEARNFSGQAGKIRNFLLAFSYRRYAYILLSKGQWRNGHRYLRRGVLLDPLNMPAWIYLGFASLLPFLVKPIWSKKITFAET